MSAAAAVNQRSAPSNSAARPAGRRAACPAPGQVRATPPGQSIDWAANYFLDAELAQALIDTSRRGARVRLVAETHFGSLNFNGNSRLLNDELLVRSTDPTLARTLLAGFREVEGGGLGGRWRHAVAEPKPIRFVRVPWDRQSLMLGNARISSVTSPVGFRARCHARRWKKWPPTSTKRRTATTALQRPGANRHPSLRPVNGVAPARISNHALMRRIGIQPADQPMAALRAGVRAR